MATDTGSHAGLRPAAFPAALLHPEPLPLRAARRAVQDGEDDLDLAAIGGRPAPESAAGEAFDEFGRQNRGALDISDFPPDGVEAGNAQLAVEFVAFLVAHVFEIMFESGKPQGF